LDFPVPDRVPVDGVLLGQIEGSPIIREDELRLSLVVEDDGIDGSIDRKVVPVFNKDTWIGQGHARVVAAKKGRKGNGIPRECLKDDGGVGIGQVPLSFFRDEVVTFICVILDERRGLQFRIQSGQVIRFIIGDGDCLRGVLGFLVAGKTERKAE
jgi:hypothetical protein